MGQSQSASRRARGARSSARDARGDGSNDDGTRVDPRAELRAHARSAAADVDAVRTNETEMRARARADEGTSGERTRADQVGRVRETTTIRNHVNLNKASLDCVMRRANGDGSSSDATETATTSSVRDDNKFGVTFKVDCDKPCRVSVAYVARELSRSGGKCAFEPASSNPIARTNPKASCVAYFDAGLEATFTQSPEDFIDARSFGGAKELTTSNENNSKIYPCVIRLECVHDGRSLEELPSVPPGGLAPLEPWVQAQTTYVEFERSPTAGWTARCVKQKIWVNGSSYELQEIYGITELDNGGVSDGVSANDLECVICLTERRDTTVLPCRHLCMCAECAHHLRTQGTAGNVCPICRNPVESLLEIRTRTE